MNSFDAYLLTRGDHLHYMMTWLIWIFAIFTVACVVVIMLNAHVYAGKESTDAEKRTAKFSGRWAFSLFMIFLIILVVKSITPNSEDMIVIYGIREITNNDLRHTAPVTDAVLRKKFPGIISTLSTREQQLQQQQQQIDSLVTIIKHLKRKQYQLHELQLDSVTR